MKPNEAAVLIGIHANTVRKWTADEFHDYFGVGAQGGDGHYRALSDDDVRILAYIAQMKAQGLRNDEIHAALQAAQQRGFDQLPFPSRPSVNIPMSVVPRESAEAMVRAEQRAGLERVTYLEEQVEDLKEQLSDERTKSDDLIRRLAEAETLLRLYREGRLKPDE